MRLSVSSYSFSKYAKQHKGEIGYPSLCDLAKEIGFEGIEFINLDDKALMIECEPIEEAKKLREYCAKIGLPIVAYAVGANFLLDDVDAEVERVCRLVDVCAELGAPVMRHDVCYSLPEGMTWQEAVQKMAPHIRRISEYARKKGVRTCTENHGFIFQAPERVKYLMDTVACDNYGWLCDIGNFLCADAEPAEAVKVALPYTVHAHVKDFLRRSADEGTAEGYFKTTGGNFICGTVVGHGIVPVKECLDTLKSGGYDGWLTLEFEGREDNLTAVKESFEFLKKII